MTVTDTSPAHVQTPSNWHPICPLDRLQSGRGAAALVGERQIALFRIEAPDEGDELYAIDNIDPVCGVGCMSRGVTGDVRGEPMVASPMYKQRYSLVTGMGIDDPNTVLDVFEVRVVDGRVEVSLP